MTMHEAMTAATAAWLKSAGGVEGIYYQASGTAIPAIMVLEKDVETTDQYGSFRRVNILTIASGTIGDCISRSDYAVLGEVRYNIDSVFDDPGHLMRLVVSPA